MSCRPLDRDAKEELRHLFFRRQQLGKAIEALERLQTLQHCAALASSESTVRPSSPHRCAVRRK